MNFLLIAILSFAPITSSYAFATSPSLQDEVIALKDTGRDYFDTGAVCEEVARVEVAQEYPAPQYKVVTGISYDNGDGTAGELDVIVFDNNLNKAIKIGEVKCWKDLGDALLKAHKQRERFLGNMKYGKSVSLKSTHGPEAYTREQFANVEFITIAQKGAKAEGFDAELEYTLPELMELRELMLKCQHDGKCKSKDGK